MSDALPSLSEIIERALASRLADVCVSMPGFVVDYDPATQTATVQPGLRRVLFNEDDEQVAEEIHPIKNVPVSWPGGSGLTIHGTLAAGDTGDLHFSSWSHNEWQATGRVATPGDLKPHNLGSAKFYPGLRSRKNAAPDTDNSIGVPGGLRIHFGGTVNVGTGAQAVPVADKLVAHLQSAAATAVDAAVPNDGGKAAFTAFSSALTAIGVSSGNLKADP